MSDEFKKFGIEYDYESSKWCFNLKAASQEDAEARLRAIRQTGQVYGEIVVNIKVPGSEGAWMKFLKWIGVTK